MSRNNNSKHLTMSQHLECAIELGSSVELWRINRNDNSLVCDRTVFNQVQWQEHEALWQQIDDAAHRNEVSKVEFLMAHASLLGVRVERGTFANCDEAIIYFEHGRQKLAKKAHQFVSKVDKSAGTWRPLAKPSMHL